MTHFAVVHRRTGEQSFIEADEPPVRDYPARRYRMYKLKRKPKEFDRIVNGELVEDSEAKADSNEDAEARRNPWRKLKKMVIKSTIDILCDRAVAAGVWTEEQANQIRLP